MLRKEAKTKVQAQSLRQVLALTKLYIICLVSGTTIYYFIQDRVVLKEIVIYAFISS